MKKRIFSWVIAIGVLLILISLYLLLVFQIRTTTGAEKGREIMEKLNELLPDRSEGAADFYQNLNMPVLEIDGRDYVAIIEIPSMDIALPVADNWKSDELFISPARFFGSAYDNSLVIGGTDSKSQLSFCNRIENGAKIIITDMTGGQFTYTVATVERLPDATSDRLLSTDYDLTLFCRSTYSMEYVAVRCILK